MTTAQSEAKNQNCWWWEPNQTNISRSKHTETIVCVPVLCTLYTACDIQVICTNYISCLYSLISCFNFHCLSLLPLHVTECHFHQMVSPLPTFPQIFFPYPFTFPSVFNSPAHITQHLTSSHFSCPHRASPVAAFFFHSLTSQPFCIYLPLLACLNPPITYSRDLV